MNVLAANTLALYLRLSMEDEGDRDESNSITSQSYLLEITYAVVQSLKIFK